MLLILSTPMQCFSFKDGHFPPLKNSSSVNISKSNNQPAAVHKVIIRKSVNSFVAHKHVSVVSRNFIRPHFASKPVCNVLSKPVKFEVPFKPVFHVPSKSSTKNVA